MPNLDKARHHTEKETDLLRILLTLPWAYTQFGQSKAPYRKRNRPVEDLADAAMGVYPIWTKQGTI